MYSSIGDKVSNISGAFGASRRRWFSSEKSAKSETAAVELCRSISLKYCILLYRISAADRPKD